MIGKRRFTVILVALGIAAGVEVAGMLLEYGGWSQNGQLALLGVVGFYMGSKFAEKNQP